MTNKAELLWAYAISHEKVFRQLVERKMMTEVDAAKLSQAMLDQATEETLDQFSASGGCAEIIRTYWKARASREEYVSLTEIARKYDHQSPSYVIQSWLRSRNTMEFLRIWESEHNPLFNESSHELLVKRARTPSFTLTPKIWIKETDAIGLISAQGKGGGTFAHPDIAIDFHMWLVPELRMNLIKVFHLAGGRLR